MKFFDYFKSVISMLKSRQGLFEAYFDPYDLELAEDEGEISESLLACSKDPDCPDYAQAIFWVAANKISEATTYANEILDVDLFEEGVKELKKAYVAGSPYAANELGLIYMDYPTYINLDISRHYFESGLAFNDFNAAYNIARLIFF